MQTSKKHPKKPEDIVRSGSYRTRQHWKLQHCRHRRPHPPHISRQDEHVSVPFLDAFSLVADDPFETSHLFCKQRPAAAAILPNTQKHSRIQSNIPSLITDDCNPSTGLSCKKEKRRNMLCTLQILVQTFDPSSEFLLAFYPLF